MRETIVKRPIHHEIPEHREINITALIDVVFQLLIFFMLASSLVKPNQIELDLPTSSSGVKAQDDAVLAVQYRMSGSSPVIVLNDTPVEGLEGLIATLLTMKPAEGEALPRVDLMIDQTAPYQQVIELMDAVREAGFGKFSLLTLVPDAKSKVSAAQPSTAPDAG